MFHSLKSHRTLDNSTSNLTLIKLEILNKNMLYVTHELDKCVSMLRRMELDNKLQAQASEYFGDEDIEHIPEEEK